MIEINGLKKSFGDLQVLKGIDLTVNNGEVLSVIGSSGSGKSTLLYCINALEGIDSGSVTIDGVSVHDKSTDLNLLRQNIGMVFQQWNTFPHLTVQENVALAPRKVKKIPKQKAMDIAAQQLEYVGLSEKMGSYPSELSGGQQQRVAIARALAMEPSYMLFDEATSALDPELVGEVEDTMKKLAKAGMTMILVTHSINFARDVSDRIAFFHEGKMEEIGTPDELLNNTQSEHTKKFLSNVR